LLFSFSSHPVSLSGCPYLPTSIRLVPISRLPARSQLLALTRILSAKVPLSFPSACC
jgi:hypothetical protein